MMFVNIIAKNVEKEKEMKGIKVNQNESYIMRFMREV